MIEGFKLDFTSEDLQKHVKERADYHNEKMVWYAKQIMNLKAGGVRHTAVSNDPIGSLERSQQEHSAKKSYFMLIAEHIIPAETYRLTETDLSRLEFIDRYF